MSKFAKNEFVAFICKIYSISAMGIATAVLTASHVSSLITFSLSSHSSKRPSISFLPCYNGSAIPRVGHPRYSGLSSLC